MSNWGRSFYNNLLALPIIIIILAFTGEGNQVIQIYDQGFPLLSGLLVLLSCFTGLLLSLSGFTCREAVSATSFSVIGNMNKFLTVLINCTIWDKHATPLGLVGIFVSLVGGILYTRLSS